MSSQKYTSNDFIDTKYCCGNIEFDVNAGDEKGTCEKELSWIKRNFPRHAHGQIITCVSYVSKDKINS